MHDQRQLDFQILRQLIQEVYLFLRILGMVIAESQSEPSEKIVRNLVLYLDFIQNLKLFL